MKNLLLTFLLLPLLVFAQNENAGVAQFKGGESALQSFLRDSLRYPSKLPADSGFAAKIKIRISIDSNGKAADPVILSSDIRSRSSRQASSKEAQFFYQEVIRLISSMPLWKPAMAGRKLEERRILHISFQSPLPESDELPDYGMLVGSDELSEPTWYTDVYPKFPGPDSALHKYIGKNMQYPSTARAKGIEGRVILRTVVTKDGSVDHISIIKSIPELDREALRLVEMMPSWEPGSLNGRLLNVYVMIPVTFKNPDAPCDTVSAQYPGGIMAWVQFVRENLHYPDSLQAREIFGKITVELSIDSLGFQQEMKIINIEAFNLEDPSLRRLPVPAGEVPAFIDETNKLFKLKPRWIPAECDKRPVASRLKVFVVFEPKKKK